MVDNATVAPTDSEHHGYLNRLECKWYFPTLIKNAKDAVGVTGYKIPAVK